MTLLRGSAVAVVLTLALTGCSGSDSGGSDGSGKADAADPTASVDESKACSFLSAADRKQLAGVALDEVVAADARSGGSQCRWSSTKGLIEVTSVPATSWAKTLPDVIDQLGSSSEVKTKQDRKDLARAKKLLADAGSFDGAEACKAFDTLAEIDGADKDTDVAVKYLPISSTEVGVSAQVCSAGVLTSLVYSEPGLVESKAFEKRATAAVRAAQKRATA
ncbi:MAG: hypothetical protein JWQ91_947 [Aeromicrobium sp.]|uniref:hypothetical protein n=1 Tax=Aeromicrobium sp. TaxID=1871063 RepID=UPI00260D76B5|nr:hypothetical protein [Aeromicrobium sp.]MCW2824030.1 hypothetical protein [Aeromicrobium sp.]